MTKQFREAALFTRPDPEAEALRLALLDWRARLLVSGYVPRSAASALLEAHGRDVVSYEAGRSDHTQQFSNAVLQELLWGMS